MRQALDPTPDERRRFRLLLTGRLATIVLLTIKEFERAGGVLSPEDIVEIVDGFALSQRRAVGL